MKCKKIPQIVVTLSLLLLMVFMLNACEMPDAGTSAYVPVYKGMTITSTVQKAEDIVYSGNDDKTNNGNHYGHYKGDSSDKENPDKDNPFPLKSSYNLQQDVATRFRMQIQILRSC